MEYEFNFGTLNTLNFHDLLEIGLVGLLGFFFSSSSFEVGWLPLFSLNYNALFISKNLLLLKKLNLHRALHLVHEIHVLMLGKSPQMMGNWNMNLILDIKHFKIFMTCSLGSILGLTLPTLVTFEDEALSNCYPWWFQIL